MRLRMFRYANDGIMVNVEDGNDAVFANTDLWVKAQDIETLNNLVTEAERKWQEAKNRKGQKKKSS